MITAINPEADQFYNAEKKWKDELNKLRLILFDSELKEDFKWKHPCYTLNNKNIIIVHGFKEYCALLFFEGVLLTDPQKLLNHPTRDLQSDRQMRFKSLSEIERLESYIRNLIQEAINLKKAGVKVKKQPLPPLPFPEELKQFFKEQPKLEAAFKKLTPGRQKAYIFYFSSAKQSQTRIDRIEKNTERILKVKGLNDCICGLSKRKPQCDGSHKTIKQS